MSLCSCYRGFIQDFAKRAAPLYGVQNEKNELVWTPECDASFADVKVHQCSATQFQEHLNTESEKALDAPLSQVKEGRKVVLPHYSRCLWNAERNYCVTYTKRASEYSRWPETFGFIWAEQWGEDHSENRPRLNPMAM
uniref:Retrovirus-related Pol polyprotein from transposon opus n=1 Tax=Lygus hesperus TaxID=30085 RepID=A0A0A9YP98_LYGHE